MNFKTIRDAAAVLGVAEHTLRRAVAAGTIPSMKLGTRAVVDIDAVADLLKKPTGVSIETVNAETGWIKRPACPCGTAKKALC